jgi:hypothetical protein
MTTQNLTTARFVLQSLLQELEEFDRCIPVAHHIQVGDVADALMVFLADRQITRLTTPNVRSPIERSQQSRSTHPVSKRKARVAAKRRAGQTASLRKSGTASRSTR